MNQCIIPVSNRLSVMGERFFACVAQLAEHTTLNRTVEGSIPSARIGMGEPIRFIWPRSLVDYDGGLSSRRCSVQFRPGSYAPYREERLQSAKLHEDGSIPPRRFTKSLFFVIRRKPEFVPSKQTWYSVCMI